MQFQDTLVPFSNDLTILNCAQQFLTSAQLMSICVKLLCSSATLLAPDLTIGIEIQQRRNLDLLSFHEMAHASHFTKVGILWWEALMAAESSNGVLSFNIWDFTGDPYGDGTGLLDGYIAVAESWAENIARDYTGTGREWLRFWDSDYIPGGLYNDLEDVNENNADIIIGIRDNINGFTRGQMFNALTPSVNSIAGYRDRLRIALPSGNTPQDYNNLFDDYIP